MIIVIIIIFAINFLKDIYITIARCFVINNVLTNKITYAIIFNKNTYININTRIIITRYSITSEITTCN